MGQAGGKGSPPSGVRSLQKDRAWSHVLFQVEYTSLGIVPGQEGTLRAGGQDQDSPHCLWSPVTASPAGPTWVRLGPWAAAGPQLPSIG